MEWRKAGPYLAMPRWFLEVSSGDIMLLSWRQKLLPFSFVKHTPHRFFHLADGLVRPSLVLKALIIRHDTNCFLDATFDLVSCSTHHMVSFLIDYEKLQPGAVFSAALSQPESKDSRRSKRHCFCMMIARELSSTHSPICLSL
jgi:hypothetical protein